MAFYCIFQIYPPKYSEQMLLVKYNLLCTVIWDVMSKKENEQIDRDRRKAIKITSAGVAGAAGVSALSGSALNTAKAEHSDTWDFRAGSISRDYNNHTNSVYGIGQGLTVKLENHKVFNDQHHFEFKASARFGGATGSVSSSFGSVDEDDLEEPWNGIARHVLELEQESNPSALEFRHGSDVRLVGCHPADTGPSLDDIPSDEQDEILDIISLGASVYATVVSGGTLAALGSIGLATTSIMNSLADAAGDPAEPGDAKYVFDTSGHSPDVFPETNYFRWTAKVDKGETAEFTLSDYVRASANYYRREVGKSVTFKLNAGARSYRPTVEVSDKNTISRYWS